ncbi:S-layer homology domain-containing protein [Egicoccus sp. AB-alg2]|uniref:S-layer homology domain-containing protein n=1 Tax=Egicoccus sp. AB-alg2 TaxID=3242693 RepID=UPI00359E6D6C
MHRLRAGLVGALTASMVLAGLASASADELVTPRLEPGTLTTRAEAGADTASEGAGAARATGGGEATAATSAPALRTLDAACPAGRVPAAGFRDLAGSAFVREVDCLAWYGVTQGRTRTTFAPGDTVTRRQMAQFLYRLLDHNVVLPRWDGESPFPDVPATAAGAQEIAVLASPQVRSLFGTSVVAGGTDGRFRPNDRVTRAQMGSFLARVAQGVARVKGATLERGACRFTDDAAIAAAHRDNVHLLCELGVAAGRSGGRFDPGADVTRGQMAAFQMRLQDVVVDESLGVPPDLVVPLWVDNVDCVGHRADGTSRRAFCTIQAAVDHAAARHSDAYPVLQVVNNSTDEVSRFYDEDVVIPSGLHLAVVGDAEDETYGYTPMYGSFTVRGASTELDLAHLAIHTRNRDQAGPDGVGLDVPDGGAVGVHQSFVFNRGTAISLDRGAFLVMLQANAGDGVVGVHLADGDALLVDATLAFAQTGLELWPGSSLVSLGTHYERLDVGLSLGDTDVVVADGEFHEVAHAYVHDHTGGVDLRAVRDANRFDTPTRIGEHNGVRSLLPRR